MHDPGNLRRQLRDCGLGFILEFGRLLWDFINAVRVFLWDLVVVVQVCITSICQWDQQETIDNDLHQSQIIEPTVGLPPPYSRSL